MRIAALGLTWLVLTCPLAAQDHPGSERQAAPEESNASTQEARSSAAGRQAGEPSQAEQAASAAPRTSGRKTRASLENCKKIRWVNRATPGFGGGPMTMSRVAVCAD